MPSPRGTSPSLFSEVQSKRTKSDLISNESNAFIVD